MKKTVGTEDCWRAEHMGMRSTVLDGQDALVSVAHR
jgi:hypothetical protein